MLVLLAASVLTIITGDLVDTVVILTVVVLNTLVGVVQEVRADSAVAALGRMSAPTADVLRDGEVTTVAAAEVVLGDLLLLVAGDVVAADAVVLETHGLQLDESLLTGESLPVERAVDAALQAGSVVTRGRGLAVVTATGAASATGRIGALLGSAGQQRTPLQQRLAELSRLIALVAAVLCAVVLVLGLVQGQSLEVMLVTAISLAVAAVPESLPVVTTMALALGARRMSRHRALVRRLAAVETLGSVTLLATDKTGTLTEGRMIADHAWTPSGGSASADRSLLEAVVLCNDGVLEVAEPGDEQVVTGDPTETAMLVLADDAGIGRADLLARHPRVDEVPFDSERRRMTTVHTDGAHLLAVVKGAPEVVLDRVRAPAAVVLAAQAEVARLETAGSRVIAVASRSATHLPAELVDLERDLDLLGLVAITDLPRPAARGWLDACRRAGIQLMLITGDSPGTAAAVARQVGLAGDDTRVATGDAASALDVAGLQRLEVVARVSSEQKLQLVRTLQRGGHVVAMVGDGVNDGPALRQADIGVAMGQRGTEVAKQAADVVLVDDALGALAVAVEEGRRVYANVRRFLRYGLSGGLAEVLVMLVGPAVGIPLPLLAAQILWINLLTHGLPGVAIGLEPGDPDVMTARPRSPAEGVLGDGLGRQVLVLGAWIATVSIGVGVWAHQTDRPWQTMLFLTLGLLQLGVAVALRSRPGRFGRDSNPTLLVAVALAAALHVAAAYAEPLRSLLGTDELASGDLAVVLVAASLGYLATKAAHRVGARRAGRTAPTS